MNNRYRQTLEAAGMVLSGQSPDGRLVEIVELADHPWFVASQFHPEFKSPAGAAASAVRRVRRGRRSPCATAATPTLRVREPAPSAAPGPSAPSAPTTGEEERIGEAASAP